MELELYGAVGGITGSCHIFRVNGHQILLDCGLLQGPREVEEKNHQPFPFDPGRIDAVVLSHAHIDHSGRLPLLVKRGFTGPIYTQNATKELCSVLLQDSARLAERDAEYENRRRRRKRLEPITPLYGVEDAIRAVKAMQGQRYGEKKDILPGISVRFQDAGHILGSAMVELWLSADGVQRKIVFSGDIGQYDTPILNDPSSIETADLVLMESTYGSRLHRDRDLTVAEIGEIISAARHDKGNVLIPAFSVGRSQEVLYFFGENYDQWGMDRWQVFLDSPMAIEASEIYWDYPHLYDEEATKLRRDINEMPRLNNLHLTRSVGESQVINRLKTGAIIIAGSGMCTGGRIVHHLKHNIWRRECHVIIVGYQAKGTLGRRIVDGAESVRIHGEDHRVAAHIHTVGGLSAHADQNDLLRWVQGFKSKPTVCIVHGEAEAKETFSRLIQDRLRLPTRVPSPGEVIDLANLRNQPS